MVFQILKEMTDGCCVVAALRPTREAAELFIARKGKRARSKAEQKKLSIVEVVIPPDHPIHTMPYLPGDPLCRPFARKPKE